MLLLTFLCLVFYIFITIILVYIYYKLRVFMTWQDSQVNQFFQLYLVRSDCRRDQPSLFWFAILHIF